MDMDMVVLAISVVQVILAIFLIAVVIFQSSKRKGLSGAIAGGTETFFGKNKARSRDAKLARLTVWAAVAFAVTTLVLNVL